MAGQEKVRGNGGEKDRMERNQRSKRERNDFNETHPDDGFGVKITRMHTRKGPATLERKHVKSIHSQESTLKSALVPNHNYYLGLLRFVKRN